MIRALRLLSRFAARTAFLIETRDRPTTAGAEAILRELLADVWRKRKLAMDRRQFDRAQACEEIAQDLSRELDVLFGSTT